MVSFAGGHCHQSTRFKYDDVISEGLDVLYNGTFSSTCA